MFAPKVDALRESDYFRSIRGKQHQHDGKPGAKGRSVRQFNLANEAKQLRLELQLIQVGNRAASL